MSAKKTMFIAVAAAVLIAAVVIFALNYSKFSAVTPDVKLADPVPSGGAGTEETDPGSVVGFPDYLEITTENVQSVIASLSRADSYHRTAEAVTSWEGGSALYFVESWVSPAGLRTTVIRDGDDEIKNILLLNGTVYIWYEEGGAVSRTAADASADSTEHLRDELQMMATYEDVLDLKKNDIAEAGYVASDGGQYITVRVKPDRLGYSDKYYISIETGLLEAAETYCRDKLVYRMNVTGTELAEPAPELFIPPVQ